MNWHTNDGAGPRGPWTEAQVVQLIQSGQLRGGHVAQDGAAQWVPLAAVPVFEQALRAAHAPRRKGGVAGKIALAIGALIIVLGAGAGYLAYQSAERKNESRSGPEAKQDKSLTATVAEDKIKVVDRVLIVPLTVKAEGVERISIPQAWVKTAADKGGFRLDLTDDFWTKSQLDAEGRVDVKFKDVKPGKYTCEMFVAANGRDTATVKFKFEVGEDLRLEKDKLTCTGRACEVVLRAGMVEVTAPKGTAVTFAGKKQTVQGKSLQLAMDIGGSLANIDPKSPAAVDVPVTLAFPDGVTVKGKLPMNSDAMKAIIGRKLAEVVKGGVAFAGDDAAPAKARLVADLTMKDTVEFYGSGKNMKSVDLVAIGEWKTQKGSCGSYRDSVTGAVQVIEKLTHNLEVIVYERRTGKVKVRKLLNAPPGQCPSTLSANSTAVNSSVDDSAIKAFIRSSM